VRLKAELCISCGNCVEACPFRAVLWDGEQNKPEICVHCGYCVPYCPYDVLRLEEVASTPTSGAQAAGSAAETAGGAHD
jgi:Fe-S-cluster-containing hydrogenase component 2